MAGRYNLQWDFLGFLGRRFPYWNFGKPVRGFECSRLGHYYIIPFQDRHCQNLGAQKKTLCETTKYCVNSSITHIDLTISYSYHSKCQLYGDKINFINS